MKITKVETIELRRSVGVHWGVIGWLWVRIHTDEGLIGIGETCPASAVEKAVVLGDLAPLLMERDPRDIEAIWHDLLLAVQYRGWAGAEIRAQHPDAEFTTTTHAQVLNEVAGKDKC